MGRIAMVKTDNRKTVYGIRIIFTVMVLLLLTGFLNGCKKKEAGNTDIPSHNQAEIPSKTEEKDTNPLNLTGYQFYENPSSIEGSGNIQLIASIQASAKVEENYLTGMSILSYNEDYVLVTYSLMNKDPNAWEEVESEEKTEFRQFLALFSTDTGKLVEDVVFEEHVNIQRLEKAILVEQFCDSQTIMKTYDYELNEIGEMEFADNTRGVCSQDGKRIYYKQNQKLYVYDTAKNSAQEIIAYDIFLVDYINGVLTDEAGHDYVVFDGVAEDYNPYQFIFDASTGRVVRIDAMENKYSSVNCNTYMQYEIQEGYINSWLVGVSKDKAYDCNWNGNGIDCMLYNLINQDLFFSCRKDNMIYCYLYDYKTGTLLGNTSFDITEFQEPIVPSYDAESSDEEPYGQEVFLYDAPVYAGKDTLFLCLGNYTGDQFFLKWEIAREETDAEKMSVTEHEMGSIPSVDISGMNNMLYVPGELSEEFHELRAQADRMEEKYSVEIYIGQECGGIMGGYAIAPLTDYVMSKNALDSLETEMAKYPANFFPQFTTSWIEGISIYLVGDMRGTRDDLLDYAGGVRTTEDNRVCLVMDCQSTDAMTSTFHHELCHAIEDKVWEFSNAQEEPIFTDEKWNALNPYEDIYTYTYDEYGYQKYYDFIYDVRFYGDGNLEEVYFVDAYAMTYPSEDRARLFESVMSKKLFDIDFSKVPHLKEKLGYFAQCIRESFDTTGWKDVMWELD